MLKLDLLQSVIAGVGLPEPRALGFVPPLVRSCIHAPQKAQITALLPAGDSSSILRAFDGFWTRNRRGKGINPHQL